MNEGRGWAIWLTGRPASGKSTLACLLWQRLQAQGVRAVILDSDELRPILTPEPTYAPEERTRFYRGLVDLAALITRYGVPVIIAATGSQRVYREWARQQLDPFAEVWVRCPLDVCQQRDPKGLYARAEAGQITALPGVGVPYEPPEAPALIVDTDRESPEALVEKILAQIPFLRA